MKKIKLKQIPEPKTYANVERILLSDETILKRKSSLLKRMEEFGYDYLIIYADKEHGANFEYLTGFIPRFEEGMLLIDKKGECSYILGNENLHMPGFSRIKGEVYHSPYLSLPNQPMNNEDSLSNIFKKIGLTSEMKVGIVGWKLFTPTLANGSKMFDLPYFIVVELLDVVDEKNIFNACDLFINGEYGVRTLNNANEIAHYEYGANLSSTSMLNALNKVEVGVSETELGGVLNSEGQLNTVVTIAATGTRFEKANLYPTSKKVKLGDRISMAVGYKGGFSNRKGFVVENAKQLPADQEGYLEKVAIPYIRAVDTWLTIMEIGKTGNEIYQAIEKVLPQETYGWHLNPGHLTADEEWMSSPIYPGSSETIKSGMIFQIDIIPAVSGYNGTSAEECVAIANEQLKLEIKTQYPALWERIEVRRDYLETVLNMTLSDHILPLSNTVGYLRPFFLAKDQGLVVE